jgi:hypothetical protein
MPRDGAADLRGARNPDDLPRINPHALSRRTFLKRTADTAVALGAADFLGYLLRHGDPNQGQALAASLQAKSREGTDPHYLIYWFVEGGWESYDMFSPVDTPNHVITRLPEDQMSKERYRVLKWGQPDYHIQQHGNIRYGYLAEAGKSLLPEMAVLSSMHTGSFHSGERLGAHMGSYDLRLQADREADERSVMQAFAEVYGQPYVLPNVSWHWWLSDGELNEVQYTGRKGYYHALGPAHAHTIYAGTPANLRDFLQRMQAGSSDVVNRQIRGFLDDTHRSLRRDADMDVVKSYNSARQIYANLAASGGRLSRPMLSTLFADPALKERFKISAADELITYQSINGNKARTKFAPSTNVQAMMCYELMRADLSCAFWIETRDIRQFDSHHDRKNLWEADRRTPRGQPDQTAMMNRQLWEPLLTLVDLLKKTPHKTTGRPLYEHTTIVLTSEFGRTIHGDVDAIRSMNIPDVDKQKMIDGQDISQHWKVTSAAFLGGKVKGDQQFGGIGKNTLMAIPLMPDGSMDPAFDPATGDLLPGRTKSDKSQVPNHGDVNATALYLCDIAKKDQKGRNQRAPLPYVKKA